jgi:predicted TIM-barrel fold metal-dependent hydrolase
MLGDLPIPPARFEDYEAAMASSGIDAAVISTGPPGASVGDRRLARAANEGIAALMGERFAGLATLPLPDVDASLSEIAFGLDTLGLDGVMLLTSVAGVYLGDERWDPVLEELDRRGAYVFVHPGFPPHALPLPHHPVWLYEFPFETVRAVANLIYSGALERYPRIRFQLAHLGGAAPFLAHRLASLADRVPEAASQAPAGALAYLKRFYYDTGLADNAAALAATREIVPEDRIVYGTDWPYAVKLEQPLEPPSENAAALVPRLLGR